MQLHTFPVLSRRTGQLQLTKHEVLPHWLLALRLSNPASWLLPMAALTCGCFASGQLALDTVVILRIALGLLLVGPFLAGINSIANTVFAKASNDDLSAANTPKLGADSAIACLGLMTSGILLIAKLLESGLGSVFFLTSASLAIVFALNIPPFYLKHNSWWSSILASMVVVGLPWLIGHVLFASLTFSSGLLAGCFAFGAIGVLMLFNLHRSEGDRLIGLRSLPALMGRETGLVIGSLLVDTSYLAAAIITVDRTLLPFTFITILLLCQIVLQTRCFSKGQAPRWAYPMTIVAFAAAMAVAAASPPAIALAL